MGMTRYLEEALALKLRLQSGDPSSASRSIYAVASSVQSQRPDLEPVAAADGSVTLMFSDIEGFTQMTEALGDTAMHELMQVHNAIVRAETAAHDGHEVELRGDGFLLAFASPVAALGCAVALQRAFARHNGQHPARVLRVRIGLHAGEVIRDADKFFGKTVIQAFRIADLARADEILVSEVVRASVEGDAEARIGSPRTVELKGIRGEHQLFPVEWI
jgi:adenylate cyclase